jgi:transcriptional regulator with XRE-family HTH domain
MMEDAARREALASFLRTRRARLAPADVGLPSGGRRRTPGLRREEVALLAHVGISWYTALEQGRDIRPSSGVLSSLAEVLRLTPDERRHLFLLAGQPLKVEPPAEEYVSSALLSIVASMPYPSYVLGYRWDYLAWNQAADDLFEISQAPPPHQHNLVWQLFTNPAKRRLYPEWEQVAQNVIAEFRAEVEPYHGSPGISTLIADLRATSLEFRAWWEQHAVLGTIDRRKVLQPPRGEQVVLEYITLRLAIQPSLKLISYMSPVEAADLQLASVRAPGREEARQANQATSPPPQPDRRA